ncbi:YbaK/EbsC family protein [Enterococcus sp. LJL120]
MADKNEVESYLSENQVPYEAIVFPTREVNGTEELLEEQLNFPKEIIYKTLVLKGDKTGVVIALVPLTERMDYKAVAKATGNRKIGLPPIEYVVEQTGYEHGANTPFGIRKHHPEFPILIDEKVQELPEIVVSAGELGKGIKLSVKDFIAFIQPQLTTIVKK